jgi:hypothetical protein
MTIPVTKNLLFMTAGIAYVLQWANDHKVGRNYIDPGKPVRNAFAESFIAPAAR